MPGKDVESLKHSKEKALKITRTSNSEAEQPKEVD
jgi:hypothetical protein